MNDAPVPRRLLEAELVSVGSEITVGETRDTNSGELAGSLTSRGVRVRRLAAIPDELDVVRDVIGGALTRVDLVVTTGGLGPTPDDLTREAIAAVLDEELTTDESTAAWLRDRYARRGLDFPESNLKQAWLIASAEALPNPNGTAPGWFVRAAGGRIVVALPGPPREMRAMWADEALPRLEAVGLGTDVVARTYRLHGMGESQVAETLGDALLRADDPQVATYARVEAVDVRVSSSGPGAADRVAPVAAIVEARLGSHVWATGATTWADAIDEALATRGWTVSFVEIGMGGALTTLLGHLPGVLRTVSLAAGSPGDGDEDLPALARRARDETGSDVGLAVRATPRGEDTAVSIALVTPDGARHERRLAFMGGSIGRSRAALTTAHVLLTALRDEARPVRRPD
jgi:nicotinamide-nucleotide amidase